MKKSMKSTLLTLLLVFCLAFVCISELVSSSTAHQMVADETPIVNGSSITCESCKTKYINGFCLCKGELSFQQAVVVDEINYVGLGLDESYLGYHAIYNAGQLYWLSSQVNKQKLETNHVVLIADVAVNDTKHKANVMACGGIKASYWREWLPLNVSNSKLIFDGNGHTISGIFYKSEQSNVGFVGAIDPGVYGSEIKNLSIVNSYFSAKNNVGAFCGKANNLIIKNCYSASTIVGQANVGGFVGSSENVEISQCNVSGGATGADAVGGIVGKFLNNTEISLTYNIGDIKGETNVGGLVGVDLGTSASNISFCHNVGKVEGDSGVGGIIGSGAGEENKTSISDCYFSSNAFEGDAVGLNVDTLVVDKTESRTAEEFASGKVAYELNERNNVFNNFWKQTIKTDGYPRFVGKEIYEVDVYKCHIKNEVYEKGYSNVKDIPLLKHEYIYDSTIEPNYEEQHDGCEIHICAFCDDEDKTIIEWETLRVIVGFNVFGGEKIADEILKLGESVLEEPQTTRKGFKFAGWYEHENLDKKVEFPFTPTYSTVVFAKWEACTHENNTNRTDCEKETICSECDGVVLATGHDYGAWVITKPATKGHDGEQHRICKYCGEVDIEEISKIPNVVSSGVALVIFIVTGAITAGVCIGIMYLILYIQKKRVITIKED